MSRELNLLLDKVGLELSRIKHFWNLQIIIYAIKRRNTDYLNQSFRLSKFLTNNPLDSLAYLLKKNEKLPSETMMTDRPFDIDQYDEFANRLRAFHCKQIDMVELNIYVRSLKLGRAELRKYTEKIRGELIGSLTYQDMIDLDIPNEYFQNKQFYNPVREEMLIKLKKTITSKDLNDLETIEY